MFCKGNVPLRYREQKRKDGKPIARKANYDGIAKQWHRATGYHGGAFKRYVLNDRILE